MRNNAKPLTASNPEKSAGLTLVELLVAISVLGFVAVLGWRGLDSIVRARVALTSELEQTRGMQLAFAQLQSDCAHLASAAELPDTIPLAAGPGWLALVRTVFADNQPSRLQVITYRLKDGMLSRRESAATRNLKELDSWWLSAINDTETNRAVILQSDVTSLALRLWSNGSWRTGTDALPAAQATSPPGLPTPSGLPAPPGLSAPTGLEVTLKLRGHDTGMVKIFLLGAV
ncbi:MAG: prepilin-type N-terminal cleavage/methylation domain-containing protein [Nitrosomonadales bacterium]|nr:prepilin-type N-terminal cleavage/methylation domain-containing protein [Nitrosomonadales bacterium]